MPTSPQRSYSPNLRRDHEWLLAWKAVRLVMFLHSKHVERNGWTPVPIAASKGARLLGWSESTWRRAVAVAVSFGWLDREVRSGRVKGNPRGYNPGSLYLPQYRALDQSPHLYKRRIPQPSQRPGQPSQISTAARSERVQLSPVKVPETVFARGPNLDPVLSKERERGRDSGSAASPSLPTASLEPLEHPSPTPSLEGRGDSREGIPSDVVAAVRAAIGPPLAPEQRARLERERAARLRAGAEGGHGD
jgi:hypothetical protein